MLLCITKTLKHQELHGHTMEIRISIFIQTPLSNAYPIFVMVYVTFRDSTDSPLKTANLRPAVPVVGLFYFLLIYCVVYFRC